MRHSPGMDVFTHQEALQTVLLGFYGGVLIWPPHLSRMEWGAENSKLLIMTGDQPSSGSPPPHRVTSLEQKTLLSPGRLQGIQELCVRDQVTDQILE